MSTLISEEYRRMQEELHRNPNYGVASVQYAPVVADILKQVGAPELLDYITPAAGYVGPMSAILIGLGAGVICYLAVLAKPKLGYDDSLDVVGVHCVGGIVGALLNGFFASKLVKRRRRRRTLFRQPRPGGHSGGSRGGDPGVFFRGELDPAQDLGCHHGFKSVHRRRNGRLGYL